MILLKKFQTFVEEQKCSIFLNNNPEILRTELFLKFLTVAEFNLFTNVLMGLFKINLLSSNENFQFHKYFIFS